ncbi:MAG: DUF5058 family protein [Clostridia bacterium]|nr:DUF5058 family protein [Clostridia bacterium]
MFFNSTLSAFQAGFTPDSWVMYLMYGLIVAFVSVEAIYYLVKSIRRAKKIGMDMGKIKRVITTSATFSVLPAIGIGIGVVTLVGAIGIALPAIRLSVVGSLQYETQVADAAASAMAGSMAQLMQEGVTPKAFVTIAFMMTLAIIWGCLFVVLFYKRLQPKLTKLGKKDLSASKSVNKFVDQKKINIGDLAFQIAFIGMIIAYLSMAISTVFGTTKLDDGSTFQNMYTTYGYYNLIAVVVAAGCMMGFDVLVNKLNWKWLDSFSTAFSMIIAMVVVAIIAYFAQVNGWDPTLTVAETVKSAALLI